MTDLVASLASCSAALAAAGQPQPVYQAIDREVQRLVGHKLFTLLVLDGNEVSRVYSSNPAAYAVSGRKPYAMNPWGDHVLRARKIWIGRSADDIRWAFADHALIISLGLESCVNVPVVHDDRVIGTMNVLHRAGWFDESKAKTLAAFIPFLVPGFVATARF